MEIYDIIIVGAGPAGLTAGIYAGRAGLKTIILDKAQSGGTANIAPLIENYPGIDKIPGVELMAEITKQTKQYTNIREFSMVLDIHHDNDHTFLVDIGDEVLKSKYIILATGTEYKTLDVKGMQDYIGRGVSYCAVCDGSFFIDREVLIVGGGNSAATEALYLNRVGVKCSIVHRRDKLRCDRKLQEDIKEAGIKIYWNSEITAIHGDSMLESVDLYNNKTKETQNMKVNGVFIAIGYDPNNQLAHQCGVVCDQLGYVKVDDDMQTNIDGIFAVGDITGGMKQIIVSEAQGAIAVHKIDSELIM